MDDIKANLFLIGAPKSGTSAVAEVLNSHPDVFLPYTKEPRFFDARTFYDMKADYPLNCVDEYMGLYLGSEGFKYRLDASVFNMYSRTSIEEILDFNPSAKFVVVLRDPIEASISMHKQRLKYVEKNMREISTSFMECWNLLGDRSEGRGYPKGCRNKFIFRYDLLYSYEKYIPYIRRRIERDKLLILFYDDLKRDSSGFYKELFCFLDIPVKEVPNRIVNKSDVVSDGVLMRWLVFFSRYIYKFIKLFDREGLLKKRFFSMIFSSPRDNGVDSNFDLEVEKYFMETRNYIKELKER
ncbi:sulfotransferase family protein [Neptuniibacter sp. QD37_6]|uniref:sulfotransferase family protein n=1 Tax=Neptuniibacter sp. QD37_6 TaxID=3398210 RepID=UPI0039F46FC7